MKKLGIDTMEQFSEKVMKERGINPEVMNNEHIEALLDYLKNC